MRFLRDNSLSLFFLLLLLVTFAGQSLAGWHEYNSEQVLHGDSTVSWGYYVTSSSFWAAVMENWQSEFLQFSFFIAATIWLIQRGSNESKPPEDIGLESDQKQQIGGHAPGNAPGWARTRGWRTAVYSHSLLLVMTAIFFATWFAQSLTDKNLYNANEKEHGEQAVSWASCVTTPDFWEKPYKTGNQSFSP